MCNEYNGWTNYETWLVNLELIQDLVAAMDEGDKYESVYDLECYLKQWVEELFDSYDDHPWKDRPQSFLHTWAMRAISGVNWAEIARHYAEDLVAPMGKEAAD